VKGDVLRTAKALLVSAMVLTAVPGAVSGRELLPEEIKGWRRAGPDGVFSADSLYELIDGAAEVYRAFNVREVRSRRYVRNGGADIIADLFDMGSPADAFGAYHFDMREGRAAGVGRESEIVGSSLAFWKDRYFVTLTPLDDNPRIREAVLALGRAIAGSISGDGPPPDLFRMLPREGLISSRIHYFHDWAILDLLTDFGEEDIFGLSDRTEGILARYRLGNSPDPDDASLLLVRYPSSLEAQKAYKGLEASLAGYGVGASVRRSGTIVAMVPGEVSRERSDALIDAVFAPVDAVKGDD